MPAYSPLKITGNQVGLVQERENFLLPDDAYPVLVNAYVFRERILRKQGFTLLGRLERNLTNLSLGNTTGGGNLSKNLFSLFGLEATSQLAVGSVIVTIGGITYTDNGLGVLVSSGIGSGTVNYTTGAITISGSTGTTPATINFSYYPGLPVMGIRIEEQANSAVDKTIFFDQVYAYIFNGTTGAFQEFIPGTTWNAHGADVTGTDFFFSTNYWISGTTGSPFMSANFKLFWVTNNTGQFAANMDPVRITDGNIWVNFNSGTWNQLDAGPTYLVNFLAMLPFRGRMVTFNTWEGVTNNGAGALNYSNRIRWSTIGNPFIAYTNGPPAAGSWRDDIRGQGGFLDIPTSEDIVAVGFVRDNLVVYCERSTWQLRYTGRSIAPFQIERVNSELGVESLFSAVQFDTSLLGIGDKGIVECDSYKSERIDIKIPDFIYQFNSSNNSTSRVQGIRDFPNRLAYWTCPLIGFYDGKIPAASRIYPNVRLVYNYENDSWATFTDTLTALGNYQSQTSTRWIDIPRPWVNCNFPWINFPIGSPQILAGNQQGFVEILNGSVPNDGAIVNDVSLYIDSITSDGDNATVINSPNHNLVTGAVIEISGITANDPYADLNGGIFGIVTGDSTGSDPQDNLSLFIYDPNTNAFSIPQIDASGTYLGGGLINLRENFNVTSKKFNFLDEGQNIQMGYLDILVASTAQGAFSLNIYLDYDDVNSSNGTNNPDTFFNTIIPTSQQPLSSIIGTKFWQRIYCATRASFLTLQYTFSNAQLVGQEQTQNIQIDAQVLWIRRAGRMTSY